MVTRRRVMSRVMSLILAAVMMVASYANAFAYGSKTAEKLNDGQAVVDEKGVYQAVGGNGTVKGVIVQAIAGGSKAEVVVDTAGIASALNSLATGAARKATLPVALQSGSLFKGYQVVLAKNGKVKTVKKITLKDLQKGKYQLDASGNLVLKPVFKVQKFKVAIKTVKLADRTKVKGVTIKNCTYDAPAKLADASSNSVVKGKIPSTVIGKSGATYVLTGYTTVKGGTVATIKPDEIIFATGSKKTTLNLYPVYVLKK